GWPGLVTPRTLAHALAVALRLAAETAAVLREDLEHLVGDEPVAEIVGVNVALAGGRADQPLGRALGGGDLGEQHVVLFGNPTDRPIELLLDARRAVIPGPARLGAARGVGETAL